MATFTYDSNDSDQKALVDRVRVKIDEVTATGQTIGTNGDRIYEQLVEAMRTVLSLAAEDPDLRELVFPLATDASSSSSSPPTTSDEGDYLKVEAPTDFIELVRIKLASWSMPVAVTSQRVIKPGTVQYEKIQISYAAPDEYAPVVAKVSDPTVADTGLVLECYPSDTSNSPLAIFSYLGDTAPEEIPFQLEEVVLYEAAGNILQNYRDELGAAQSAYQKARLVFNERAANPQPVPQQNES